MAEDVRVPRSPDVWRPRARQPGTRCAMVFLAVAVLLAIPGEGKKVKSRSKKQGSATSTQCEQQAKAAAAAAAGGKAQEHLQAAIALAEYRSRPQSRGRGYIVLVRREPPDSPPSNPGPFHRCFKAQGDAGHAASALTAAARALAPAPGQEGPEQPTYAHLTLASFCTGTVAIRAGAVPGTARICQRLRDSQVAKSDPAGYQPATRRLALLRSG